MPLHSARLSLQRARNITRCRNPPGLARSYLGDVSEEAASEYNRQKKAAELSVTNALRLVVAGIGADDDGTEPRNGAHQV